MVCGSRYHDSYKLYVYWCGRGACGVLVISMAISKMIYDINIDQFGLPVDKNGDGGDSLQRLALIAIGQKLRQVLGQTLSDDEPLHEYIQIERAFRQLVHMNGSLVRHPSTPWYDPYSVTKWATSRDQTLAAMIMLDLYGFTDDLIKQYNEHALRWFAYQNFSVRRSKVSLSEFGYSNPLYDIWVRGDLSSPEHWNLWQRLTATKKHWWFYITDISIVVGTVLELLQLHLNGDPNNVDDDNRICALAYANVKHPTFWSKEAANLWAMYRPRNSGNALKGMSSNVLAALAWKHRDDMSGVVRIWKSVINKLIN